MPSINDFIGHLVTLVLAAGGVYAFLVRKIDALEDRCADLEGDAKVAKVERDNLKESLTGALDRVEGAMKDLSTKLEKHMDEEPRHVREAIAIELTRFFSGRETREPWDGRDGRDARVG